LKACGRKEVLAGDLSCKALRDCAKRCTIRRFDRSFTKKTPAFSSFVLRIRRSR